MPIVAEEYQFVIGMDTHAASMPCSCPRGRPRSARKDWCNISRRRHQAPIGYAACGSGIRRRRGRSRPIARAPGTRMRPVIPA